MNTNALADLVELEAEPDGTLDVYVPSDCLWDCVECFSENRLEARFTFKPPYFIAHLPTASAGRIEEALRDWKPGCARGQKG